MKLEQLQLLSEAGELSGKVLDVDIDTYHAVGSPGVSKSDLDLINDEPFLYYATKISGEAPKKERSSALDIGQMVHNALLEPEKLVNYVSDTEFLKLGSRQTKAYKEAVEKFEQENPDKVLMKQDDYEQVMQMVNSAMSVDLVRELLSGGKAEQSYYWQELVEYKIPNKEKNKVELFSRNILFKARPDYIKTSKSSGKTYITEIKTTAQIKKFKNQIINMRYNIQAVHFLTGIAEVTKIDPKNLVYVMIACDKNYPYTPELFMLDEASLIFSEKQRQIDLETLAICLHKNHFPKRYEDKDGLANIKKITLPNYVFYDLEFSEDNK